MSKKLRERGENVCRRRRKRERERENRDNRTIVLSLFGRMSSCCYVTIVYSNPLVQLPRALFISSLRYPLCNRFALLWQALTGLWLWCGPVKHTDQSSPPFFFFLFIKLFSLLKEKSIVIPLGCFEKFQTFKYLSLTQLRVLLKFLEIS